MKCTSILKLCGAAMLFALLIGCDSSVERFQQNRSGGLNDAYVEEPLGEAVKKYRSVLDTSNVMMEAIAVRDAERISRDFVRETEGPLSPYGVANILTTVNEHIGPLQQFKQGQWWFTRTVLQDVPVVISNKIALHGKGSALWQFIFFDDGKFEKVVGLHAKLFGPEGVPPNTVGLIQ